MRTSSVSELLQPSLSSQTLRRAPYSLRVGLLVGFFGGFVAVLVLAGVNAHRVGRWPRDLAWLMPALLAGVLLEAWWWWTPAGQAFNETLQSVVGPSGPRYLTQVLGLLGFGLSAWLHRREQRTTDLMGLARPDGTRLGVALVLLGLLAAWVVKGAWA
jgi:hypothetical protein